jgi:hypothetical protein
MIAGGACESSCETTPVTSTPVSRSTPPRACCNHSLPLNSPSSVGSTLAPSPATIARTHSPVRPPARPPAVSPLPPSAPRLLASTPAATATAAAAGTGARGAGAEGAGAEGAEARAPEARPGRAGPAAAGPSGGSAPREGNLPSAGSSSTAASLAEIGTLSLFADIHSAPGAGTRQASHAQTRSATGDGSRQASYAQPDPAPHAGTQASHAQTCGARSAQPDSAPAGEHSSATFAETHGAAVAAFEERLQVERAPGEKAPSPLPRAPRYQTVPAGKRKLESGALFLNGNRISPETPDAG